MYRSIAVVAALFSSVQSQLAGTLTTETHPALTWETCTTSGGCTEVSGSVTVDANWRWTHNAAGTNCYTGNEWDTSICINDTQCAQVCAIDGADYAGTYGVTTSGNSITLKFVTVGQYATNVGSRLYLLASDTEYQEFSLLNKEFTFDVDVSNLPCGLNGAVYFVAMAADGGMSQYPGNKAGAKYGTGYCDSQCPRDLKFIDGEANVEGWIPSSSDPNSGIGNHGSCCPEMDVWEANSISNAVTPHPCTTLTQTMCNGTACGGTYSGAANRYNGECDPDGCDFNPYRMGNTTFYGPGMTVNTNDQFTVVTQFIGSPLTSIRRLYVQNGVIIANSASDVSGVTGNSITSAFCDAQKTAFGDINDFDAKGGMTSMSETLEAGMVLVLSLWDDHYADMLWLDSDYPTTGNPTSPGVARGTCPTDSGVPATVESDSPNASVTYSNIRFGDLNSTYSTSG